MDSVPRVGRHGGQILLGGYDAQAGLSYSFAGGVGADAGSPARRLSRKRRPETRRLCATFYPFYALTALLVDGRPDAALSCLVQPQDGCLRDYALSDWDLYHAGRRQTLVVAGGRGLESFEEHAAVAGRRRRRRGADALQLAEQSPRANLGRRGKTVPLGGRQSASLHERRRARSTSSKAWPSRLSELYPQYAEQIRANLGGALTRRGRAWRAEMRAARRGRWPAGGAMLMNEALVCTCAEELGLEIAAVIPTRKRRESLLEGDARGLPRAAAKHATLAIVLVEKQAPAVADCGAGGRGLPSIAQTWTRCPRMRAERGQRWIFRGAA